MIAPHLACTSRYRFRGWIGAHESEIYEREQQGARSAIQQGTTAMMIHVGFFVFLFVSSALFACMEIQAEGKSGWAAKFPTWRYQNALTKKLYGEKPLTGYHVFFALFLAVIVHIPYAIGLVPPSLRQETRIVAYLILFLITEDFLWFVLNPWFGIKKFRKEDIWWHAASWWWIMPRDYWIFVPLGMTLYVVSFAA
jgi:hypothetical protein